MQVDIPEEIVGVLISGMLGALGFLLRSYFSQLKGEIQLVSKDIGRLEGHLAALDKRGEYNTIAITQATSELKAIWRHIDGAHKRASDNGSGHAGDSD